MNTKKKTITLGLIGLILFFPYIGMAEPMPEIPLVIQGDVSIGGSPAANGTTVSAFLDGAQRAQHIVANPGKYAMAVSGSSATDNKKTIKLFVNGVDTSSTAVWKSGEIVTINLAIAAPSSGSTTSPKSGSYSRSGAITQTPAPVATSSVPVATQTPASFTTSDGSAVTQTPVVTSSGLTVTQTPVPATTSDESTETQTSEKSVNGPGAVMTLFLIFLIFRLRGKKQ